MKKSFRKMIVIPKPSSPPPRHIEHPLLKQATNVKQTAKKVKQRAKKVKQTTWKSVYKRAKNHKRKVV